MNINIVSISEIEKIAPVFHEYREGSISYDGKSSIEESETWLRDRISNNEANIFSAVEDNKIIGFATLYNGFSSISLKKYWVLNDLYVIPAFRRKGCAKLILKEVHRYAKATNSKGIALETGVSNKKAQSLYENLGYKEDKLYKHFFWHNS
jgi:GNAT superfamily N-acetyltransferase